eukprot:4444138-Amphidinium_carterae.1
MSCASTFKACTNICRNVLLSTIESGQKEPHPNNSNDSDTSSSVRERRSMLLTACVQLTCYGLNISRFTSRTTCCNNTDTIGPFKHKRA